MYSGWNLGAVGLDLGCSRDGFGMDSGYHWAGAEMDLGCSRDGFGMDLGCLWLELGWIWDAIGIDSACSWELWLEQGRSRGGVTVGIVVVAVVAARIRSAYRCTPGAYRCVQMATGVFQVSRWRLRTDIQGTPGFRQAPEAEPGFWGGSSHRYQGPGWIEGVHAPQPSAHLSQVTPCLHSDVLALPIFKQEESSLPPENQDKLLPFQYVLCAATSPAVKLHDETLTYLNQGEATPALHRYPWEPAPAGRFCLWKLSFLEGNC